MTIAKRFRATGIILLIGGLLAAVIIYFRAPLEQARELILGIDVRTNRDVLQLEKVGGKSAVFTADFEEWFATIWHGKRLAYTVGVLSIAGCAGCYLFADFIEFSSADDAEQIEADKKA
jgi:hypothetical protein